MKYTFLLALLLLLPTITTAKDKLEPHEALRRAFIAADEDGDGKVAKLNELATLRLKLNGPMLDYEIDKHIRNVRFKTPRGKFSNLRDAILELCATADPDTNGDGFITLAEFNAAVDELLTERDELITAAKFAANDFHRRFVAAPASPFMFGNFGNKGRDDDDRDRERERLKKELQEERDEQRRLQLQNRLDNLAVNTPEKPSLPNFNTSQLPRNYGVGVSGSQGMQMQPERGMEHPRERMREQGWITGNTGGNSFRGDETRSNMSRPEPMHERPQAMSRPEPVRERPEPARERSAPDHKEMHKHGEKGK